MEGLNKDKTKSLPITKQMVWEGYLSVKRNRGGAGVDRMTIKELEKDLGDNLYKLWNRMSSGSYFPPAVRRVLIPKGGKGYRPLGIPTVLDRTAQSVVKAYIEPRLEAIFHGSSYGYRPGRSAHQALERARVNCRKYDWVIDLDIKGFFENIDQGLLLKALEKHVTEKWVMMYVKRWLEAGVLHEDGRREEAEKGTPQGGVISPLLANLYLHYAFDVWISRKSCSTPFERYADDIIIHCKTEEEATELLDQIKERLGECGLEINPDKTRIVYCKDSNRKGKTERPKKFTFLGYDFKPRKRMNRSSKKRFVGFDLGISGKAKVKIKTALKEVFRNMSADNTLEEIAGLLNARLRGWIGYYAKFSPGDTRVVWHWLNYRLVLWRKKHFKRHKNGSRSATRWIYSSYKRSPSLFAHWQLAAPGQVVRRAV